MNWITCTDCGEEFRIITELATPEYCPFCAAELDLEDEDEDEDDYWSDED